MASTKQMTMRRQYLVDRKMQLSVVLSMVGVLFLLTLAYVVALAVSNAGEVSPSSASVQRLGFIVTGLYFFMALLTALIVGIMATQRIAGPARLLENAVRGLRDGDYEQRLTLRTKDHLQSLAAEIGALRGELQEKRSIQRAFHDRLREALSNGDHEAATRLHEDFLRDADQGTASSRYESGGKAVAAA